MENSLHLPQAEDALIHALSIIRMSPIDAVTLRLRPGNVHGMSGLDGKSFTFDWLLATYELTAERTGYDISVLKVDVRADTTLAKQSYCMPTEASSRCFIPRDVPPAVSPADRVQGPAQTRTPQVANPPLKAQTQTQMLPARTPGPLTGTPSVTRKPPDSNRPLETTGRGCHGPSPAARPQSGTAASLAGNLESTCAVCDVGDYVAAVTTEGGLQTFRGTVLGFSELTLRGEIVAAAANEYRRRPG